MKPTLNNARRIIANWIRKANSSQKYNESFCQMIEEVTGEPNDRTAYDAGNYPQELVTE